MVLAGRARKQPSKHGENAQSPERKLQEINKQIEITTYYPFNFYHIQILHMCILQK